MTLFLKIVGIAVVLAVLAFGGRLTMLGQLSKNTKPQNIGVSNGHLKPCGSKPNCVSSQSEASSDFYIAPLSGQPVDSLWENLKTLLEDMGFVVQSEQENYIHAVATTRLMGFVDDLEFLKSEEQNLIEVRSASRVGYSDLGVNRKRVEAIRQALTPEG
jgi:uncharacterized protein (DUF1499 family)